MTHQAFIPLAAALLFSTAVVSPASLAYFAVSLPGNAMTMSGSYYAEPVTEPAVELRAEPQTQATHKPQPARTPQTTTPRKQHAATGLLHAPGR